MTREHSVERYTAGRKPEWDTFVNAAKNATFLFSRDYMDYHSDRFADHSLMIFNDHALVAVLPANLNADGTLISHEGLTYGGLLVSRAATLGDVLACFHAVLRDLSQRGDFQTALQADSGLLQHAPRRRRGVCLVPAGRPALSPGLHDGGFAGGPASPPEGITRADQESDQFGSPYRPGNIVSAILGTGVGAATGGPVRSQTRAYPRGNHPARVTLSRKISNNSRPIAAMKLSRAPPFTKRRRWRTRSTRGHGKRTKSGRAGLSVRSLIEQYKDKRFFDFGTSNEKEGRALNHGLLDWKEGFGARCYTHDFYEIATGNYPKLEPVLQTRPKKHFDAARDGAGIAFHLRRSRRSGAYFAHPKALIDEGVSIGHGTRVWAFAHIVGGATSWRRL
jgi:hypothetical protein